MIITTLPRITSNRILDEQTEIPLIMDQTLAVASTLNEVKSTHIQELGQNGLTHNTGNILYTVIQ
jgi:hypothetical protein